ncbi:MAG: helix-turn-helix domain-containing protein [Roseateles sp.]|uniref:helix-turn-helix domain-containing protein n=1 Tax=Roseateles sp. TaxID=1971397 RepID=UPI0040374477
MSDNNQQQEQGVETTLAAKCVRALLERHGVPRNKHSAVVTDVLGLSYSQGNRRLTTRATWELEELRTLAEHYGETLTELVSLGQHDEMQDATLVTGTTSTPCRVARGPAVHKPRLGALVLTKVDADWLVLPAEPNLATQAYDIKRLLVEPSSATSRRIAVLDDHPESAQLIVSYLKTAGFDPVAFTNLDRIAASAASGEFDGYVLDWIIVKDSIQDTVSDLVAAIRARDAHCPIVVLTGQMRNGIADEAEIATAMAKYRLKFFEKPAPLPIISAALATSFSAA